MREVLDFCCGMECGSGLNGLLERGDKIVPVRAGVSLRFDGMVQGRNV